MPPSPSGHHPIAEIDCRPDAIHTRATSMKKLGDEMVSSAKIIKEIKDGSTDISGLSMDKLREVVEDFSGDLMPAGEKYKKVGEVFEAYSNVLRPGGENVMADLNASARRCQQLWEAYVSDRGAIPDVPSPTKDEPEPDTSDHDDAQKKADGAYDDFKAEADRYDGFYQSWDEAFTAAAKGMEDFGDGGLDDSWKDELDSIVGVALEVLTWVGIAVCVLCIIIGGPILAAIALAVGILVLLGTAWQVYRGDAGMDDLAWAIVGVIPVTKLARYGAKLATVAKFDQLGAGVLTKLGPRAAATWRTIQTTAKQSRLALAKNMAKLKNAIGHDPRKDLLARLFFGAKSSWSEISRTNKHTLLDMAVDQAVKFAGANRDFNSGVEKLGQRIYQGLPDLSHLKWA